MLLETFIKLPFVVKAFVLSILSGRFRQVFTVLHTCKYDLCQAVNTKIKCCILLDLIYALAVCLDKNKFTRDRSRNTFCFDIFDLWPLKL